MNERTETLVNGLLEQPDRTLEETVSNQGLFMSMLFGLLVGKGILDEEEFWTRLAQLTTNADQALQEVKQRKLDDLSPTEREQQSALEFLKKITGG